MQEPVREMYRGFEIQLILRHRDEDGRIETTVFIHPTPQAPRVAFAIAHELGFSTLHDPKDSAPVSVQMNAARKVVDDAIESYRR